MHGGDSLWEDQVGYRSIEFAGEIEGSAYCRTQGTQLQGLLAGAEDLVESDVLGSRECVAGVDDAALTADVDGGGLKVFVVVGCEGAFGGGEIQVGCDCAASIVVVGDDRC
ncbi:MAG TPA: hypothetical protein V6D08_13295 [Candidatus Obscuribacterales bacterium]